MNDSNNNNPNRRGLFGAPTTAPSSAASVMAPTSSILKKPSSSSSSSSSSTSLNNCSCKRNRHLKSSSASRSTLQFALPPTMEEEAPNDNANEQEEQEESDTDIASHCDDEEEEELMDGSFSFDADTNADADLNVHVSGEAPSPENKSPMLLSRVGAKVRRLNLNSGGNDITNSIHSGGMNLNHHEGSSSSSPAAAAAVDAARSPMRRKQPLTTRAANHLAASPNNNNHNYDNDDDTNGMLICPPSTIKKKSHSSRLFANCSRDYDGSPLGENNDTTNDNHNWHKRGGIMTNNHMNISSSSNTAMMGGEDEDDVSPRDVIDFPFFHSPSSSSSNNYKRRSEKENEHNHHVACPPSTIKKKTHMSRIITTDDNNNHGNMAVTVSAVPTASRSPPRGLRTFGRANSFLQMFSQEMIMEEESDGEGKSMGMGGGGKESIDNDNNNKSRTGSRGGLSNTKLSFCEEEEDAANGEQQQGEEESFLHKPKLDRNGSILREEGGYSIMRDTVNEYTLPSPRRPMRTTTARSRLSTTLSSPPSSPPRKGGRHSDPLPNSSTTTTCNTLGAGLLQSSFSRFQQDFEIVGTLGNGTFGCVYSVRNRTDLRLYAIKAAKREARGPSDKQRMLQEVYALAALSDSVCVKAMHIVRYHQAWMEGNRLYIQTELCELTLAEEMSIGRASVMAASSHGNGGGGGPLMDEKRRYKLLREMLLALSLIHENKMIHLDIKPENIFIKNDQYKLGDFGLVSKLDNHSDVEEGDSRYMSMELLSGDLDDLTKSDIFSLGATLYEICLSRPQPLPENGQEWQDMRHGTLLPMPNTPFDMQMILREMMHPDRHSRPSAEDLLKKRQLLSDEQRQLIVERNKANAANRALDAQMQRFKLLSPADGRKKFHRSNTIC